MQLLSGKPVSLRPTALAIGKFDGLHLGHRYLIARMHSVAAEMELSPAVLTFYPHPEHFYGRSTPLISTREQKLKILEELNPGFCFEVGFDESFASVTAEDFMRIYLVERLKAKAVVVGEHFRFGYKRAGDTAMLEIFCRYNGIKLLVLPRLQLDGEIVSSSAVRKRILDGDMQAAADFLGHEYLVRGTVVEGDKLGSKMGFPTANMCLENELLPPDGVYAARIHIDGAKYKAMLYIGNRPTFNGDDRRFELNILDYEGSLYGARLEVFIIKKVRADKKFANKEELIAQINQDRQAILAISY